MSSIAASFCGETAGECIATRFFTEDPGGLLEGLRTAGSGRGMFAAGLIERGGGEVFDGRTANKGGDTSGGLFIQGFLMLHCLFEGKNDVGL